MSSDAAFIEVVGVEGPVLEFWSATVPPAPDCFVKRHGPDRAGADVPLFALAMLRGTNNHANPLAARLADADVTEGWYAQHGADFIASMELVASQYTDWRSGDDLWSAIHDGPNRDCGARAHLALAPSALYRLTVRDARDIAHLKPGDVFGTSAFSPSFALRTPVGKLATGGAGPFAPLIAAIADASACAGGG